MSKLKFLLADYDAAAMESVAVTIRGGGANIQTLNLEQRTTVVELEPDTYSVTAQLPNGEQFDKTFRLKENSTLALRIALGTVAPAGAADQPVDLQVELVMYGQALDAPVSVDVLDARLNPIATKWLSGYDHGTFSLTPGTYVVRAALPSGRSFEKVVDVASGPQSTVKIPVHKASPHEGHEWAYVSREIDAVGSGLLSQDTFAGMWARLWSCTPGSPWVVEPLENPGNLFEADDGVSFSVNTQFGRQTMLQIGGDNIPWKLAMLPPNKEVMILIRPATGPAGRVHPVDIVISSSDWQLESLMSLLTRGNTERAEDLLSDKGMAEEAERRLFGKMQDPYGAAIGGYALLHLGALERMHTWAENLCNWFDWIPDGPVIFGWQQLESAREEEDDGQRDIMISDAREAFLEAANRGVPFISEGVRRLRDGLLMFHSNDKNDPMVKDALARVGAYTATIDFSASTTMFTGARPEEPLSDPPMGMPDDGELVSYVYDVPLADAVADGALPAGTAVSANNQDGTARGGMIMLDGSIDIDGDNYPTFNAAQRALTDFSDDAAYDWRTDEGGVSVEDIARELRFKPRPAYRRREP